MKSTLFKSAIAAVILTASCSASAGVIFYTADASNNSTNWSTDALNNGHTINDDINFDSHSVGALDGNFYSASNGVTVSAAGDVQNGAGPGQGNTSGSILGEGVHQASNYLFSSGGDLTLSFAEGTYGAGLMTIDLFTSGDFTVNVFSGQNGSGNLLASMSGIGAGLNFQQNGQYFIGIQTDDNSTFGSLTYSFDSNSSGDDIGYDDVVYLNNTDTDNVDVPEPTSLAIFAMSLLGLGARRLKNRK
jgi:hypothetical protein